MERGRHRKWKSASGIEGIQRIPKQEVVSRLSSDSRSYTDGSPREDMFVLDLGRRLSRKAPGTPMKKLLAEEMSKEVEPKRRSPSIVAKLMGLEGLASPRHVNRQQKRSSSSYQHKNVSVDFQRNRQFYDGLSNSRSSVELQEFKDVYEDLEASHLVNRRCSSRWSASSMLTKREMALMQEKFIDAKCRSTDEKYLEETLEMLHSNKDFLLNFLQRPDSLFVKQFHNHSNSSGSPIAVLKPSSSAKYEGNYKSWNSERDNSSRRDITSNLKRKDGLLLERHSCNKTHISRRSSKIQLEDKNEEFLPTRIVVLKPHIRKMQNSGMSISSLDHSNDIPDFWKLKEYPTNVGIVLLRRKDPSQNVRPPKPVSKEAREIARKIARRMRDGCDETVDDKSTCFRGYAGDESSFEANESDSDSESEVLKSSPPRSFGNNELRRYPSCHLAESSVSREAKHRLSERWKMTQRYQDLEIVPKGSTLGEMLASHDRQTMPKQLDGMMSLVKESHRLHSHNGTGISYGPVGISTRDGWKAETSKTSSRSRSIPPSGRGRSYGRSIYHDEVAEDKHLICSDPIRRSRCSRIKKPFPCRPTCSAETGSSLDANFEIQMEPIVKNLSELQPVLQMATKIDAYGSPASNVTIIDEHGSKTLFSESPEILPKEAFSVADDDKSAAHDPEDSSLQELDKGVPEQSSPLQCLGSEANSSENSKPANRASPDSVLEIPFGEDTSSSSESFERVGAELHELRMQLQLLKMESGSCAEEEIAQSSQIVYEENLPGAEYWEISYAQDVLNDSGLEELGFDMFISMWHSPDCPLDPQLFDDLENKHSDETSGLMFERRLIFDRINQAILENFQQQVDLFPWVAQKFTGLSRAGEKEGVEEVLERLIRQEDANAEFTMQGLDKVLTWPDSREEIDVVGNEIEKLIIDDMIIEVVCNYAPSL